MKLTYHDSPSRSGILLVECMVYVGLFFVVLGVAFMTYERTLSASHQLRKNADDIVTTLHAGERWREDIRTATAEPQIENEVIHIQHGRAEVSYTFRDGTVMRRGDRTAPWNKLLTGVKNSHIVKDAGREITSWRWELELKTKEKSVQLKPLFTFQTVWRGESK